MAPVEYSIPAEEGGGREIQKGVTLCMRISAHPLNCDTASCAGVTGSGVNPLKGSLDRALGS
jgi:hypothetical protein